MSSDEMSTSSVDTLFTQPWQIDTKFNDDMSTEDYSNNTTQPSNNSTSEQTNSCNMSCDEMSTSSSISSHEREDDSSHIDERHNFSSHEHKDSVIYWEVPQNNNLSDVVNIHGMPPCDVTIHNDVPGKDTEEFVPGGSVRISISKNNRATKSTLGLYNTDDSGAHLVFRVSTRDVCVNNFTCIIYAYNLLILFPF